MVGSHTSADAYLVDVTRVTSIGAIDPTFAASDLISQATGAAPVGAAQLTDRRLVIWTSLGELVTIAPDGSTADVTSLDGIATLLTAVLDSSQRLVAVGALPTDPPFSQWFVRRYSLL